MAGIKGEQRSSRQLKEDAISLHYALCIHTMRRTTRRTPTTTVEWDGMITPTSILSAAGQRLGGQQIGLARR